MRRTLTAARAILAAAVLVLLQACASTHSYAVGKSEAEGGQVGSACLNFVRSGGWAGGGSPVVVMLMATTETTTATDMYCFAKKGVRIPAGKNHSLVRDALGYRIALDPAAYRAASSVVITVPAKLHDIMMGGAGLAATTGNAMLTMWQIENVAGHASAASQSYDLAIISAGVALAMVLADEASRVELVVSKEVFERVYCDRVLFGQAIGALGPGGHLTYRTSPGTYVVQALADYYKFQGYAEWDKRAKSEPLSLTLAAGQSYSLKFTPHLVFAPTTIDVECVQD